MILYLFPHWLYASSDTIYVSYSDTHTLVLTQNSYNIYIISNLYYTHQNCLYHIWQMNSIQYSTPICLLTHICSLNDDYGTDIRVHGYRLDYGRMVRGGHCFLIFTFTLSLSLSLWPFSKWKLEVVARIFSPGPNIAVKVATRQIRRRLKKWKYEVVPFFLVFVRIRKWKCKVTRF
jgi:hypothetical protein